MIRVVITKIRNLIEQLFQLLVLSVPKPIFVFLFNFKLICQKIPDRLSYEREVKAYRIKNLIEERFFVTKPQNYNSFKNGLRKRNLKLINEYLIDNLILEPDDLVVDCGANIGDFWFALNATHNKFEYIGFEPSIQEFRMLKLNIRSKGECHNVGLWDKDEKLNFYVSNKNADSSFIKPIEHTDVNEMQGKRLDQFISTKIKLLKLEAEGAELQVLKGMGSLLDHCEYIAADLGFENLNKSTLPQVTNYLLGRNFEIIDFGSPRIVVLFKSQFSK
jgi:FkbM family methyltransferase